MEKLMDEIIKFRDDRNWKQFHSAENLAKSISIEAAELLENYQWGNSNVDLENVKDEIADILIYSLLFIEKYGFNFKEIILEKIEKNNKNYPISKSYGKSDKYNKL